jgi:FMN phosphatase YigB (HAD superfamily)
VSLHYKAVLFDIDDVIVIDNDYKTDLADRYGVELTHVRKVMKDNPLVNAYKCGGVRKKKFYPEIIEQLGIDITPEELVKTMSRGRLDERVVAIIENLHTMGVYVGALTDANPDRLDYIDRETGLKSLFYPRMLITSYVVGALKPDVKMFQAGIEAAQAVAGASACEVVIIDDKEKLIAALNALKFDGKHAHGLHYVDAATLEKDLGILGKSA